jgi:hypothetical protein
MSTHAGGGSHNDAPGVLGAAILNVGKLLEHACRHRADCAVRTARHVVVRLHVVAHAAVFQPYGSLALTIIAPETE